MSRGPVKSNLWFHEVEADSSMGKRVLRVRNGNDKGTFVVAESTVFDSDS